MTGIRLIVGLANPGTQYQQTRHNAGAWFLERLILAYQLKLKHDIKFHGLYDHNSIDNIKCHFLIPTTYMNHSGLAVRALMQYHKVNPDQVLIAHDEIDLPSGTIKLKFDGGNGGHNGLKDIIQHIGSRQFYRLRIGVGRPTHGQDVADYVLSPPSKADHHKINECIDAALTIFPHLIHGKFNEAMQNLHR